MLTPIALARLTGVSTDTLRHYERKHLLAPQRAENRYRLYPPDAVARVKLIRHALRLGFTLDQLSEILAERGQGGAPCRKVRILAGRCLDEAARRIRELQAVEHELRLLLPRWDAKLAATPAGLPAHLLDDLGGRTAPAGLNPLTARRALPPALKASATGRDRSPPVTGSPAARRRA